MCLKLKLSVKIFSMLDGHTSTGNF